jgi:peroxiredoxin
MVDIDESTCHTVRGRLAKIQNPIYFSKDVTINTLCCMISFLILSDLANKISFMKRFLFLLLPLAGFAQTKEFKLKGQFNNNPEWVYLRYGSGDHLVNDSLRPEKNGSYKFEGTIAEPMPATLIVKYPRASAEQTGKREVLSLFLEPGKIEIETKDSLKGSTVKAGQGQKDYAALTAAADKYDSKLNALYEAYEREGKAGNKDQQKKIENEINNIDDEVRESVYGSFVRNHPTSPVALYALRQYAGWNIDPVKVEPLFKSLPASVQQQGSAVALKGAIDAAKKTSIGSYAMDFTQNDTLGHPVSLSSFKGKYVLVDFWASWCGPCRRENPNVVKAFNKYKDRNFTILGVSLDRPNAKERWLKAIHDDGLTWNHVSDLKFWDNEVAKQYGIRAIPQNILLDPEGKIIAKNLSGEELDQKLADVLAK